jgi:hypothetical protein
MPSQPETQGVSAQQFIDGHRTELVKLDKRFSYYPGEPALAEDELREYLQDPIQALPPKVLEQLPDVELFLVPYLERLGGEDLTSSHRIHATKPSDYEKKKSKLDPAARWLEGNKAVLLLSLDHMGGSAEYHYRFYQLIASILMERATPEFLEGYEALIKEELEHRAYGEADDASWKAKQEFLLSGKKPSAKVASFVDYVRGSFIDTATLYLHGICCDIDVETGPQQIASKWLRKRLEYFKKHYPPPEDYAVFPEDIRPGSRRGH